MAETRAGSEHAGALGIAQPARGSRWFTTVTRFVRRKPLGAFGAFVLFSLVVLALSPSLFAPSHYADIDLFNRFEGPSASHLFGTDDQGRDVFSRVIFGARTSIAIGLGTVALAAFFATTIGIVSGYYGGLLDLLFQRLVDILQAFPGLIFIVFALSIIGLRGGSAEAQITLILILGVLFTAGSSRVVRSQAISTKQNAYVEAAQALGASDFRILTRHMFPNVVTIVIINISVQLGFVILLESSLSFLGFGIPPPFPSWWRMLNDASPFMQEHPSLALFPGLAIALTVYSLNMFGDALRDVLDPRLRGTG